MIRSNCFKITISTLAFFLAISIAAQGQTFNTLVDFSGLNGGQPQAPPTQSRDGNLYGTALVGGNYGSLYRTTLAGGLSFLLLGSENSEPMDSLTLGTDGNFYGTTEVGGTGAGSVFRVTSGGKVTTVAALDSNGRQAVAGLLEGDDGNFYGTTIFGGPGDCSNTIGCGSVFKVTPGGELTTIAEFGSTNGENGWRSSGTLIQMPGGFLYGTAAEGGTVGDPACRAGSCGTVFRVSPSGNLAAIHKFTGSDGSGPYGGLLLGLDGKLYGLTSDGGSSPNCVFGCGTVFRIDPSGTLTTLYSFNGSDGSYPLGALIQANDGNLYGTTANGGTGACDGGCGTIFQITPAGVFTSLYNFDPTNNFYPVGLIQATNGILYGATTYGGSVCFNSTCGTIFSLDMGLNPFVAFVRGYGKVGATGGILGQGFTGTTGVLLNGVPAEFTVVSDTYMTATVPLGATTGYVTVTTPSGVLTSNVPFRVIQ